MKHSECRKDFLRRMEDNENRKKIAKETGERINFKRQPVQPREGHFVSTKYNKPQVLQPIKWQFIA